MRLDARRLERFLTDPGACRAVLLFGDDHGLVRERAARLVHAVLGPADDPFRLVELERDRVRDLPAEAASLPLTGGRRVVRVRDATDAHLEPLKAVLAGKGEALVVLEGVTLPARSRLRGLLEAAPDGVAIGCYKEEGRALETTVRDLLREAGVSIRPEALAWVASRLGADRALTRQEVEKLALYAGVGGSVDLDAAMASLGDVADLSLDDALFAAAEGDVAALDRALDRALSGGHAPASALRAAILYFQRLHRARIATDSGASVEVALRSLRPPLFWRREPAFRRALARWSDPGLGRALTALSEA
ncbi:MAG: DNA polymerase III subunit delta, partial [Acetobacteraceae bacterium]|nr:DNA polymerase III subunit delta [Acetobacteraceae bacterium]